MMSSVGFVLAFRRPRNPIGWLLLAAALALGLRAFSHHYGLHGLVAAPGSWPAARAAMWLSNWIWVIPLAMLAFVFLLFPAGRLPRGGGAQPPGSWVLLWRWPRWVRW